jgi:glutamine amidotransferase
MATRLLALYTSDPALVRCELDRVRDAFPLDGDYASVASWSDGQMLVRRYGRDVPRDQVWEVPDTDAILVAAGALSVGRQLDDNAHPFRFHQWLFGQVGVVDRSEAVRERLYEQLPEFLQSIVRGRSLAEVVFAWFLSQLRTLGRIDDPGLDPAIAARALQGVARTVEQTSADVGGTERCRLALVASNGRSLVAARRGQQPLSYVLLEGQVACRRCGLAADAPEKDALVRDHRRRRSVVVSTTPLTPRDVAVPDGGALSVDRHLALTVA